jgi:tripartite-type tricarboxylate transporter receptor subunit TctC
MKLQRRHFLRLAAGAAALPAASGIAWAQAYPSRPVRIIVPVAAGGGGKPVDAREVDSTAMSVPAGCLAAPVKSVYVPRS